VARVKGYRGGQGRHGVLREEVVRGVAQVHEDPRLVLLAQSGLMLEGSGLGVERSGFWAEG